VSFSNEVALSPSSRSAFSKVAKQLAKPGGEKAEARQLSQALATPGI